MAGTYGIVCEQGATLSLVLTWYDSSGALVNLTGYTAKSDIRHGDGTLIVSLTTANSRITLGGALGTITLTLSATDTAGLTAGSHLYDLFLTSGTFVKRLLEGAFIIERSVTL